MNLETVDTVDPPIPSSRGIEGNGEGVEFKRMTYYYRVGKWIPKDKAVALKWEGNYCGRVRGETAHIIVIFNGTNYTVLEDVTGSVRESIARFKGLSYSEAIALVEKEEQDRIAKLEALPKCKCGGILLVLADEQPDDLCFTCWKESKKCVKNAKK